MLHARLDFILPLYFVGLLIIYDFASQPIQDCPNLQQ
jgi:hypothetical protein